MSNMIKIEGNMDTLFIKKIVYITALLSIIQLNFKELSGSSYFSLDYYKNLMNKTTEHVKKYKRYYIVGAVVVGGVLLYQNRELIEKQYKDFFAKKEKKIGPEQAEKLPKDDKGNEISKDKEPKNQENLNTDVKSSENKVNNNLDKHPVKVYDPVNIQFDFKKQPDEGKRFAEGVISGGSNPIFVEGEDIKTRAYGDRKVTIQVDKNMPPITLKDQYRPAGKKYEE